MLAKWLSGLGLNLEFVAGCAHFFAGYGIVLTFPEYWWLTIPAVGAYAGVKEFWFDAKYEGQGFKSNLIDFLEWIGGTLAGLGVLWARSSW